MGKDLNGKELGKGIMQLPNGKYTGRYTNKFRAVFIVVLKLWTTDTFI